MGARTVTQTSRLIVEGGDDLFSVVGLMRAHVTWPQDRSLAPVWVEIGKGVTEILAPAYLTTLLKSPEIQTLGVMLDADEQPSDRYSTLKKVCTSLFPSLPIELPLSGVVVENEGKRLGFWIMPDNRSEGCLETFLRYLVPGTSEPVWQHAVEATSKARSVGASFRDSHVAKAHLYTWLAWQDPPGQSPGIALTKKILDPHSETADPFVGWFRKLYQL